jgi:hypothetical protein
MNSRLNTISILLAAICAFLFVLVASIILIIFIGDRLVFDPGIYKQALRSENVYKRMPALIGEQITYQIKNPAAGENYPPELQRLTQDDWDVLLTDLISPASLQTQTESVIDQFFVYINTPGTPLALQISLVDFKQKLDSDDGYRAVMQIINLQPACSSDEWAQIANTNGAAQADTVHPFEDIPYCRPSDEILTASEPYIRKAIHQVVASIPDETSLNPNGTSAKRTPQDDGRDALKRARGYVLVSLCLPIGLLMLIAVFGVRSFNSGGLWLGIPLGVTGLFGLVAAAVTWALPTWLIIRYAPSGKVTMQGVAPGVVQLLVDIGTSLAHSAARTLGIVSLVLLVAGLGLISAGVLFGWATRSSLDADIVHP